MKRPTNSITISSLRNPQISLILRWQDDGVTRLQKESVCLHGMEVQLVKLLGTESCELWGESMFEALEVSKHIVVLPASPDLEPCWENLLPKNIKPQTLKYFSSSSFSFSLAPCSCFCFHLNTLFFFLCQDQPVALGGQKHHQRKEKEDLSKLFNFCPSRARSSDSSFNVPLFTVTWICLNGMGFSFWIHLTVKPHKKTSSASKSIFDPNEPAIGHWALRLPVLLLLTTLAISGRSLLSNSFATKLQH